MADLDGDGLGDLLTGSYWPGDLYFLRRTPGGAFAAPEILKGADGKNLSAGPPWNEGKERPPTESLASVPCLVDHDGDGDLDLLVGNIGGSVILIPNEGSAKKYSFDASKRRALEAGGKPLEVEADSGPVAADWDGDGKTDLVVGSAKGTVVWFRNTGTRVAPRYEKGIELLPKVPDNYEAVPHDRSPVRPGFRTKVWVADWNGDGRADLLVGDYWDQAGPPVNLTKEQTARRDALRKERDRINKEFSAYYEKLGDKAHEDPAFKKIEEEMEKVDDELSKLEPRDSSHGSVWLYLREPAAK